MDADAGCFLADVSLCTHERRTLPPRDIARQMIYGQAPPPPEQDPAFQLPCFQQKCPVSQAGPQPCPRILT